MYPEPRFPVIIEPFAGSAAYSLHGDRWRRRVILFERDPKVAEIWDWLIHKATPEDILQLPGLQVGEKTSSFLAILHSASKRAFSYKTIKVTTHLACAWKASLPYIAKNLHKIRHWEIHNRDYRDAPNLEATWFIDPPYQGDAGTGYRYGSPLLDYSDLSSWCQNRKGQTIVCESGSATWLPFRPLLEQKARAGKRNLESVWTNELS